MEPIIEVKNLGKKYNINHQQGRYISLRDVISGVFKNPFRFLKDKAKSVAGINTKEEYWALKGLDFTVNKGEVIGIIGRNGAGKSTLLKILSQITPPTTGEIKIRGRVGSLLEVGTGFHPELTGRENILLNGAILGMPYREIAKKFDQIVEFAGIDKFLDTPVKYYSSGMYVRLAFSVAAHMEPDILIIDEVLAVGDSEFQKKCLGKMDEITKKDGRTILFVSHNMGAIEQLCKRTIWIDNGMIYDQGNTCNILKKYTHSRIEPSSSPKDLSLNIDGTRGTLRFDNAIITNRNNSPVINSDDGLSIIINYSSNFKFPIPEIRVLLSIINNQSGQIVMRLDSHGTINTLKNNINPNGQIICETDTINLIEGRYTAEIQMIPQMHPGKVTTLTKEFTVNTDISKYNFSLNPDKNVCSYIIRYNFIQK